MKEYRTVYLDYAAATPMDEQVVAAMLPYFSEKFFNPSSPYLPALDVKYEYNQAKAKIAKALGGVADELVVTAGATESIAVAFNIVSDDGGVIISAIEHPSVVSAAQGKNVDILPVDKNGRVAAKDLSKMITDKTELVSIGLANNEIGTIQPMRELAEIVKRERQRRFESGEKRPIYLHSDASQALGILDVNVARMGLDMVTISAAKVYGPKQVAVLWADRRVNLRPIVAGGLQERGIRGGTENVAGVIGFARAIELADRRRSTHSKRMMELRDDLENRLKKVFPEMKVNGPRKSRLPQILSVAWDGIDAERLIFRLESQGVFVATGSACAANKGTRSKVLVAIGLSDGEADGSLRISLGRPTEKEDVDYAFEKIVEAVQGERERS